MSGNENGYADQEEETNGGLAGGGPWAAACEATGPRRWPSGARLTNRSISRPRCWCE